MQPGSSIIETFHWARNQLDLDAHATPAGIALAATTAACHAVYLVVIRGGFDGVPAVQATALVLAGGCVISAVAGLQLGLVLTWAGSPAAWAAIACAATVGALPKVWVLGGVRLIGSTRAAVTLLAEPVVAVVVAALALDQRLSAWELAGGVAILAAVVFVHRPSSRQPARGAVPAA